MQALLRLSRGIDQLNAWVGKYVIWLILRSTFISGVNAVVRKVLHASSNAFLEVQWYLFAASFLLAAGYTLLQKRARQGGRGQQPLIQAHPESGSTCWALPSSSRPCAWPCCTTACPSSCRPGTSGEMSSNAGGLIRWPVYLMMPLGFGLLLLQGVSELIKRMAFLMGLIDDPTVKMMEKTPKKSWPKRIRKAGREQPARNAAQERLSAQET